MRALDTALRLNKQLRVIGFDDAPFTRASDARVNVSGIICSDSRFEGMLWDSIEADGFDATDVLANMLLNSKFHNQVTAILTDGIAMGGFNVIDLPRLASRTARPCIAVMRKEPDMPAIKRALRNLSHSETRLHTIEQAGEIFRQVPFVYQVAGCSAEQAAALLQRVTANGHVPEALRLAHLIGSAVKTGQSSNRA